MMDRRYVCRILRNAVLSASLGLVSVIFSSSANGANELSQSFTLDGILYSAGTTTALLDSNAKFVLQILDPTKTCLLYEEQQFVNTSSSSGYYTIQMGSSTGDAKRTINDPGRTMADIFQNSSAISANSPTGATCAGGTYTPSAKDSRYLRITVTPSASGVADTLSPDMIVNSVPTATVAETLQGYGANQFLQVGTGDLTQSNVQSVFAAGNAAKITSLIATGATVTNGGQAGSVTLGSSDANQVKINTNGTARLSIDSSGNVGIGTTTPNRLLEVAGPIRIGAAALPGTPGTGDVAVDSGDSNRLKWHDGTAWRSILPSVNVETLSADKTLSATDAQYQILDANGVSRNVDLPTTGMYTGQVFQIACNCINASSLRLTVRESGSTVDIVGSGSFKQFIYNGTNWVSGETASATGGGNRVSYAAGYDARAGASGTSIGYVSRATSLGAAVGYQADGSTSGAAIGYQANGGASGAAVGYAAYGVTQGAALGYRAYPGPYSVGVGYYAGFLDNGIPMTAGNGNVLIGYEAGYSPTLVLNLSNTFVVANDDMDAKTPLLFGKFDTGNVGVGTTAPSEKFHIVGNLRVQGSTDCTLGNGAGGTNCSSDIRLKTQIHPIADPLRKLETINGVNFIWNQKSMSPGQPAIGVIAQEVESVFPTAVIDDPTTGFKKVDYAVLVAPIIEGIKELATKIRGIDTTYQTQAKRIQELENELRRLKLDNDRRIRDLERKLEKMTPPQR